MSGTWMADQKLKHNLILTVDAGYLRIGAGNDPLGDMCVQNASHNMQGVRINHDLRQLAH